MKKKMKKFASIDFLRGLAILMMLILHTISDLLDLDALLSDMGSLTLLELVLLFVLPFLGGLAGFFLMISSVGNAISMQKQLMKGKSSKELAKRQIVGGLLLLVFAMLSEGVLGYHGMIGEIFKNLDDTSGINWSVGLWRGYYFETIHTIAWCIILNGVVHAILTREGKWKDTQKLVKQYLILAGIVLALTPVMWWLADVIVPGYPYGTDPVTEMSVQYAVIGQSSFGDFVLRFLVAPLAAKWEPVFPYLAASFFGSIIGIYIAQDPKDIDRSFLKKILKFGLWMFFIGAIGFIINLVMVVINQGIDPALSLYVNISEHRYWTTEHNVPFAGWLFQFLMLNGFGICAIIMIIRAVEFRGRGKQFADKTKFIRRLGFVAFTAYTMQYIYHAVFFIVSSIVGEPYVRFGWGPTLIATALSIAFYYFLTLGWEKIGYIGSMEWMLGTIAAYLVPGKKGNKDLKWWQKGLLDVENGFYNAEWLNIVELADTDHRALSDSSNSVEHDAIDPKGLSESRFSFKLARLGFIFFPFSFVAYFSAKKAASSEGMNDYQKKGQKLGLIGIIFFIVWVVIFSSLKLSTLGISF
jgi:Heparan-alpha-glucosaminide N-acetyltransferase, catalytic